MGCLLFKGSTAELARRGAASGGSLGGFHYNFIEFNMAPFGSLLLPHTRLIKTSESNSYKRVETLPPGVALIISLNTSAAHVFSITQLLVLQVM